MEQVLNTNLFSVPLSILDLLVSTSVCVPRHSSRNTIKAEQRAWLHPLAHAQHGHHLRACLNTVSYPTVEAVK